MISAGDVHLLPHVLAVAERLSQAPAEDEMRALGERLQMEPLFV